MGRALAVAEWLWVNLVVRLKTTFEHVRFRRIIFLAALAVAVIGFAQVVSIDLAFLWAIDTAFYFEVASAVIFVAVVGQTRALFEAAGSRVLKHLSDRVPVIRRLAARQRRNANALWRRLRPGNSGQSEDDAACVPA